MPLQIYADGGYREAAGGVGGWGYLFLEEDGTLVASAGGVQVTDSPTGGEYTAIIKALRAAQDAGYQEVEVYSDCTGVVNHLAGRARILSPRVIPRYLRTVELLDGFASATVEYAPRHHPGIRAADALGCEAVDRETEAGFPARWWHKSNTGAPQGWRAARAVPAAEGWG
jgi:ribonuclease HI